MDERPEHPKNKANYEQKAELESDIQVLIEAESKFKKSQKVWEIRYNENMQILESKFYPCKQGDGCETDAWKAYKKKMEEMVKGYKKTLYYDMVKKSLENTIEETKNGISNLEGLVNTYSDLATKEDDQWIKKSYNGVQDMYEDKLGSNKEVLSFYEKCLKKICDESKANY